VNHCYWCSFVCTAHDYRPLHYPPRKEVLGWWCTGEDSNENDILCLMVLAESEDQVKQIVASEWPEAADAEWRFVNRHDPEPPSDRFPLSDWMKPRFHAAAKKARANA